MKKIRMPFAWAIALCLAGATTARDAVAETPTTAAPAPPAAASAPAKPAPDADKASVEKGLQWLATHQLADGGFGQGEESAQMGGAG